MNLDERMKAAGMMPVSEMLERSPLGRFSAHAGVTDLESFERWIQLRREEFLRMQAQMSLDGEEENELFEWVVAHNAVLGEVMANLRQATGRDSTRSTIEERNRLRDALRRIADHHEHQRNVWMTEGGDVDQAEYHEERRNFALYHLEPNPGDPEKTVQTARLQEEQVRCAPNRSDDEVCIAKESRKTAEMTAMLNDAELQRWISEHEEARRNMTPNRKMENTESNEVPLYFTDEGAAP